MLGIDQRIPMRNVKLFIVDVVQEHIDTTQIVGRDIDFLPEKAIADILLAQHLGELQQERAGTAGGVIDLIHLGLASNGNAGQQFGNFLRCKKLTA